MEAIVEWTEKEKEMFDKWLSIEEEEWARLEYRDFQRTEWGLQEEKTKSIWQSGMYKKLQPLAKDYDHFFVYLFQREHTKFYFIDVRYGLFDFRISLDLYFDKGSTEMYFKYKRDEEYGKPGYYHSLKGKEKEELKVFALSVFSLYEEFKKVVQNEPSNRLRFLLKKFRLDEDSVHQMKKEMEEKSK